MSDFAENLHTSISMVLWIHFWCYFDPQNLLWPSGGILTPKMLSNALWFLGVVGFCLNFALNFFEFWLFPWNQSYWVLLLKNLLFTLFWPFPGRKAWKIPDLLSFWLIFPIFALLWLYAHFSQFPIARMENVSSSTIFVRLTSLFVLNEKYWIGATLQWIRFSI